MQIIPELITTIIVQLNELKLIEFYTMQWTQQQQRQQNPHNKMKEKKYKRGKKEIKRLYGSKEAGSPVV